MSTIRVLFLCTGNSARSIIAEAMLKKIGGEDFEVHSAGTEPKGINPFTEQVLRLEQMNMAGFWSKSLDEYLDQRFDYVITVCDRAAEKCPVFPGDPARIHWSFPDPAAVEGTDVVKLAAFQDTLRGMRQRLTTFVEVARREVSRT
ncbi:MAG TPA: arsenate reductase ArsC [Dehalococcoidia bacterium]|jgi:arsenate reductase|nr:arsenate reductase ArsC [Dehalococcoidia bacterium]